MGAIAWAAVGLWVAAMSLVAFAAMAADKRRAERGMPRLRERTLLVLAVVGGTPGVILAVPTLRHKLRKVGFRARLLAMLLLQGLLVAAVLTRL